jgi:hypothetical protein
MGAAGFDVNSYPTSTYELFRFLQQLIKFSLDNADTVV